MNGVFAPLDSPNGRSHRRLLAVAANAALRGETHNTGRFTAPAGAFYILKYPRIGIGKEIILIPRNEAAATARWALTDEKNGQITIKFFPPLTSSADFGFVVAGVGNTKGV